MKLRILIFLSCLFFASGAALSQTVYITNSGEKYHISTCGYLYKSKIATTLDKALDAGYTACSRCKPPTRQSSSSAPQQNSQSTYQRSSQCAAQTKSGKRCSRTTKSQNGYCWQHGGN